MGGLILLFVLGVWLVISILIARLAAGMFKSKWVKFVIMTFGSAFVLIAPVADDIGGALRFSNYCKSEVVRFVGTTPISSEFYSDTGEWRLGVYPWIKSDGWADLDGYFALSRKMETYVTWDSKDYAPLPGLFPIEKRLTRIHARESGNLLAEWNSYAYRGGVLRRNLLPHTSECAPSDTGRPLYGKIFSQAKQAPQTTPIKANAQ